MSSPESPPTPPRWCRVPWMAKAYGKRSPSCSADCRGRWRDADRDRPWMDLDAQFLAGRTCAAIKFEADLLVEPDPELFALRDLGEGRLLWVPEGEPAEHPGPLNRIPGRHHS